MEKICLPNNVLIEHYLRELKFRSLVTLELIRPMVKIIEERYYIDLSIKIIIINMLLEAKIIYRDEALKECLSYIHYEMFNYSDFELFFSRLKRYCEIEAPVKLIEFKG